MYANKGKWEHFSNYYRVSANNWTIEHGSFLRTFFLILLKVEMHISLNKRTNKSFCKIPTKDNDSIGMRSLFDFIYVWKKERVTPQRDLSVRCVVASYCGKLKIFVHGTNIPAATQFTRGQEGNYKTSNNILVSNH